ncbi:pyridoxal phosphate-dependent aminotransferase [Acidisphaera sp. L21]|uniref:pyridoxal phosphate-dependent aminotransferase n=1 Tax=Acidisphaera sp. L21 TaxID=1641851 RepID=UPI00131BCE1E|nr:pyridoxal phosphate-dependent aminotransferase [Acidisphaera sp. L21]
MTQLSARMGQYRPSPTVAMSALVRKLKAEGRSIIGLVGGEPDFATPDNIKEAGIRAITTNNTRYTDVDGTVALRTALSEKFKTQNNLDYKPDQIVVTSGTKPLLHAALLAMTDPGDEVIIPAPHWVSHPDIARIAGAVPVTVPCPSETGFRLSPEALEAAITPRTRVLILNSPNNPTGTAYQEDELRALIAVLKRHPNVWVLTDEIYEHIRFDGHVAPSIAALDPEIYDRVVTANGFSKGYVMTGWRIGFAGGPVPMMKAIKLIIGQLVGSPSAIAQAAAVEALTGDQSFIEENAAIFQERRDIALQTLQQTPGLRCHTPEGAFYLFGDCSGVIGRKLPNGKVIETDEDFVMGSIEFAGVALVPGSAFGLSPYFRLSYSLDTEQLRIAMDRLRRYCNELV